MRFSTSALVVVLLQNSSLLSPNDAFSPPLSRVVTTSTATSVRNNEDGLLYARRRDDEDIGEGGCNVNNNNNGGSNINRSRIASVLLGGAAFQLSTSKVSRCCSVHIMMCFNMILQFVLSLNFLSLQFYIVILIHPGTSRRRKHVGRDRCINQWSNIGE